MTISLHMRYQGPVPLETPLRVSARVTRTDGRKTCVKGTITTEGAPSTILVEADGIFVTPNPAAARALFPALDNTT
ncbi:hotdog fold domain-containing protein [Streptomyces sp. NEAU-S7GS2]|uniref:hotdog fold domain-containing protein n=1 Tax=Streptomyces sp. NEAU-S7GS2 TaxID=2202000 RepID=UPI001EF54C0E|nr:hotdog fold domain-containing protein [Streptomyces sp. NEAU-S7GS2]